MVDIMQELSLNGVEEGDSLRSHPWRIIVTLFCAYTFGKLLLVDVNFLKLTIDTRDTVCAHAHGGHHQPNQITLAISAASTQSTVFYQRCCCCVYLVHARQLPRRTTESRSGQCERQTTVIVCRTKTSYVEYYR